MEVPEEPAAPLVGADVDEVRFEVEGRPWVARVRGRSMVGGATQLLLLGFDDLDDPDGPGREGWVVGRALGKLTEAELARALGEAGPPREPGQKPFFDDGSRRRGEG